jgi:hypothetical protein
VIITTKQGAGVRPRSRSSRTTGYQEIAKEVQAARRGRLHETTRTVRPELEQPYTPFPDSTKQRLLASGVNTAGRMSSSARAA